MQSRPTHTSQNEGCSQIAQASGNAPLFWDNLNGPVVPLERYLHVHPVAGLLCEREKRPDISLQDK